MTSKDRTELFAWIFLPGETEPVVAGRLFESDRRKEVFDFNYGKNYQNREDVIPLY
jgi:serine/threonine-protein kinase HipA